MTDPQVAVAAAPGYRTVLANREYRALWLTHVTSVLGDQVTLLVLASLVLSRTGSVALSALSYTTMFLPWLLGGPLLSVLADRCPRRTVMIVCDVLRGLVVLTMALPVVPVWGLFALAATVALLGPPFEAARGATVPDVLTAQEYPVAQSLSMASLQVAQLAGFGVGGLLVTLRPGSWALCVDAATFLLSALVLRRCVVWRPGTNPTSDRSARTWVRDSAQGMSLVARTVELRRLLGLSAVVAAVTIVPESLAVAQADRSGQLPLVAGLLCAALPFGTAVGAVLAGRWAPTGNRLALVRPLALLSCAACAACLWEPSTPVLLLLWVLAGVGAGSLLRANVAFVLRVPPELRGRALSVAQVVMQVGQGAAIAAAGLLAGRVGPAEAVGWAGAFGLVAAGLLVLRWPASLKRDEPQGGVLALDEPPGDLPPAVPSVQGPATGTVTVFALAVATVAAGLWVLYGGVLRDPDGPLDLPWWGLLPMVVAAQAGILHFQVRRQAQGISVCHLPLAIGLVCCSPAAFVVSRTLGGALAMAVVRRQRGVKLLLNTSSYALEAVVAVLLLHLLVDWPTPAALYLVMAVADITSFTVVSVAIMLFERRLDAAAWLRPLTWLLPLNVAATSFSLLAVAALWRGAAYLLLLAALIAALLLAYRRHAGLRGRHLDLGRLQELAVALPALTPGGPEVLDALERTRTLLVAECAELWSDDGTVARALADGPASSGHARGRSASPAVRTNRRWQPAAWSSLSADLTFDETRRAVLTVRDRLGAVRSFSDDDAHLLDALAALLGGGLDRGAQRQRMLDTARRDPLTGLWTLPEASRRVAVELPAGDCAGLLVVDIIGLQDVNDSLGHEAGDRLLTLTADRLRDAAGTDAVTARIGGDELLAVLTSTGPSYEEVLRSIGGAIEVDGARLELRVRGGYCPAGDDADFQQLLRHAQAALARASAGGTRCRTWSTELTVDPSRRLRLAGDLQTALTGGEVVAVFQPLCRADDLVVVGAEALARWAHPELGAVPPDEFVHIAEQTGLIGELTAVVLDQALGQASRWRRQGVALRVSVNLSPRSLTEGDLVSMVLAALQRHGLPTSALLLEITESTLMRDLAGAVAVLSRLRGAGIALALDDFGTGHSSLTQLRAVPIDEVKLDRSFLTDVAQDATGRRIVATAVALCHDLGKVVVAEGVEDQETVEFLREAGVDLLQGYFLGRPAPAGDWPQHLVTEARRATLEAIPRQASPADAAAVPADGS